MSDYLTSQVGYCLESLDKELVASYCQDGCSIDRLEERQVNFFFGTVTFKRRRLRKAGEKSFLPLDEALGLEKRQRYSPLFKEKVGQLVTGMTYRQASKSLELLTNQSMSHQSLHTLAQSVAGKIQANKAPEEALLKCFISRQMGFGWGARKSTNTWSLSVASSMKVLTAQASVPALSIPFILVVLGLARTFLIR